MSYEQKDNSGSLFANEQREKDTHANARGSATIDGVAYFVDAWTKTTKDGKKWQSLSFKKKENQKGVPKPPVGVGSRAAAAFSDEADDCPF